MSWSTEFESLMVNTVLVSSVASFSTDGYATPAYGSASTHKARLVRTHELVRTAVGTEQVANTVLWVASTSTFAPSARFTVSGTTLGTVLSVESYTDEDGPHHAKVLFG